MVFYSLMTARNIGRESRGSDEERVGQMSFSRTR